MFGMLAVLVYLLAMGIPIYLLHRFHPQAWYWQIKHCPWCLERKETLDSGTGLCYFIVGILQEFLSWSSGGKNYHVEETECIAGGGQACVIRIEKQPLD